PEHSLHTEPRGDQVAEDGRPRGVGGKVSEKVGGLPVSHARQNQLFHVFQDGLERFPRDRSVRGERGANLPGLHPRKHWEGLDAGVVVSDPVDNGMAVPPEVIGGHMKGLLFRQGSSTSAPNLDSARRSYPIRLISKTPSPSGRGSG